MENLVRGIQHFQSVKFNELHELFERLAKGQQPSTMLITCSDSRIAPELLMQALPGDVFVSRNAGNIVPPYGAARGGEGATIEYAIKGLGVRHIIVMGHSQCGAMKGLLHPESLTDLPTVADWLKHAAATAEVAKARDPKLSDNEQLNTAIRENVLVQLANLRTHPAVAAKVATRELTLHGWVYEFETGKVSAYDQATAQFVPIAEAKETAA
jgi:carbonic anhydrase